MVTLVGGAAEGRAQALFGELNRLYVEAGAPSLRAIAERTQGLSPDTVRRSLSGASIPKWSTLSAIVIALGGDIVRVQRLWQVAVDLALSPPARDIRDTANSLVHSLASDEVAQTVSPPSTTVRVVVVDDHEVVRVGLRELFAHHGVEVVGEAVDTPDAVPMVLESKPDVVLMDVRLPSGNGIAATAEIVTRWPKARVVILTSYADETAVQAAIRAGAVGFVLKQVSGDDLVQAVRDVAGGGTCWAHPKTAELIANTTDRPGPPEPPSTQLSRRELEILTLMSQGLTNRQIGQQAGIAVSTVESFVSRIMLKLGANSRVDAVLRAIRYDLVVGPL